MVPRPAKRRFWRACRIYFRRFRIAVWLLVLLFLGSVLYLNQVGLPGFIKTPMLANLRARGLDLEFSRLRLRWYEGIVAENVRFGRADEPLSPRLTLGEVRLLLNFRSLIRRQLQVDAVVLRRGRLLWPLTETNQGPRELAVESIQTDLRFLPNDQWALDNFRAVFAGADINLSGMVTNASAVRDWQFLKSQTGAAVPADAWKRRLRKLSETLEQIRFSAQPDLRLDVRGDARDLQSFTVRLHLAAPGAETPWGTVSGAHFSGRVLPAISNELSRAEFNVEAADAQTRWGVITNFLLAVQLHSVGGESNLVNAVLKLSAGQVQTRWGGGTNLVVSTKWMHELTNPVPLMGECRLECAEVQTRWGRAGLVQFTTHGARAPAPGAPCDPTWAWWTNVQPYLLDWQACLTHVDTPNAAASEISCAGSWSAPSLRVTNFEARLYGGQLIGAGSINVASRRLDLTVTSDLDPHLAGPVLGESSRQWLEQVGWQKPPQARAALSLVLPAWTNRQPDWRAEVQPTLSLHGEVSLPEGGAYYGPAARAATNRAGLEFSAVRTHFVYSNQNLHLSDLVLTRPEGELKAEHWAEGRTRDFYWRVESRMDVRLVRPFLDPAQQRAFDYFELTQAPVFDVEVHGRANDPERIGFKGRVALSNFTFRGQSISSLQTGVQYTNRVLQVFAPRILCGTRQATADGLSADFNAQRVYLTNGFSTVEPLVIANAIGPHIVRAIEAYQFLQPPVAHVYGTIPLRGEQGADLHFNLDGGPFHWWKFTVPHISGNLHWAGESLTLTNIQADFYRGVAQGEAAFNFRPRAGADFRFHATATNAQLQPFVAALAGKTNHLEGLLSGDLFVTAANTEDWRTANGHGKLNLRDGLLWDIPIFGIFSPVLNGISPGLGNSRATGANCSFVMTNGVCRTEDMEIRSSAMRLNYRGTVDLESKVNARVDAEPLRDMWLVGPVVSTIFWPVSKMFEYKVAGELANPKMDPVFIFPRLVMFPFHPIRAFKGSRPDDSSSSQTNTPPVK